MAKHQAQANQVESRDTRKPAKKGGKLLPALCNVFGTLLLLGVIGLCLPLVIPPIMGYQVYDIVSGSMEPEIPVGSVVYVKEVDPSTLVEGDVIAYSDEGGVVVHRVTVNRLSVGELVTKGDANNTEDFNPVRYASVIGEVERSVPMVGTFMTIYSTVVGKVYLLLTAACGVMLNLLANRMRKDRALRAAAAASSGSAANGGAGFDDGSQYGKTSDHAEGRVDGARADAAPKKRSTGSKLRTAAICVLAVIFLGSAGVVGYVTWQYRSSDAIYNEASDRFTTGSDLGKDKPPIEVDFATLQAQNPDIIGWIYCDDTPINYPVLHGRDNDQYLRTDYTGAYNIDGSIFIDFENRIDFSDANTIVYGHNMNSGAMFACLENWSDQSFYDHHKTMWLLTPTKNYKIVLFSGHHANAHSDLYEPIHEPGDRLGAMLVNVQADSDFKADVKLDPKGRYVMLSTCGNVFVDDRYVLHGMLEEA